MRELSLFIVFSETTLKLITFSQRSIKLLVGILFEFFTPAKLTEIQRRISLSCHIALKLATLPEYSLFAVKSSSLIKKIGQISRSRNKSNEWKSVLATLSISFAPNTRQVLPKLQSLIEFPSLNLSDLYNKISLCNISDSSAPKNSIKRQIM